MNKWHDLRKNLNDLPKEDGRYLCESKSALCPGASFMEVCNFSNDLYAVDEFDFCKYKKTKKKADMPKKKGLLKNIMKLNSKDKKKVAAN